MNQCLQKIQSSQEAVYHYCQTLAASEYDVRLIHSVGEQHPINPTYTHNQLLRSVRFLAAKNKQGYHIYCRPVGYQYVLLDDLCQSSLSELARFKPCLLLESSPDNYQAWLKLKEAPTNREQAVDICQVVTKHLGADMGSAEPDHIGRLPGFTNRKEKYRNQRNQFPYVKLHRWADRFADLNNFYPSEGGIVHSSYTLPQRTAKYSVARSNCTDDSQSIADFRTACQMLRQGKSDHEIAYVLEKNLKIPNRGRKSARYVTHTIAKAKVAIFGQK